MQLKISSFNKTLFRKNLTRFWPVWGLASAGGALFPLALLVQLMRYGVERTFNQGAVEFSSMYYEVVRYGLPILSLFYAILIAIAVWSYLYNHRSVSLMHTLPLRREGLFVTNFLSGVAMLLIPYVILELYVFCLGLGLFLSQANVFFRDIQYIYNAFTTAWMYLTPLFYPLEALPDGLEWCVNYLNPMYFFIGQFRDLVYLGKLPGHLIFIAGALTPILMLLIGLWSFHRSEDRFILYI